MTREWKPGDVAMVTWSRHPEGQVFIRVDHANLGLVWWGASGWIGDATAKEARPLVVIDPEDRDQVRRLWDSLYLKATFVEDLQAALREFASPTPPKPDEPMGLGAVAEDAEGRKWVRGDGDAIGWTYLTEWRSYDEINAVRILNEGVQP